MSPEELLKRVERLSIAIDAAQGEIEGIFQEGVFFFEYIKEAVRLVEELERDVRSEAHSTPAT